MLSPFGIDHGEISKVRYPKIPGTKRAVTATRAQQQTRGQGLPTGTQRIKGSFKRAVEAPVSVANVGRAAGGTMRGVGSFLESKPGITGSTLVGGGGAAGYKYLSQKEPKKKKT